MTHGKNLIVSIDGVPVAGAKSCQFSISQNFISTCPPTARRVFNKKPTTYDWSMSVDCLIPSSTLSVSLVDKLIAGTRVLLTFTDGSGQNRAGWAYVKSCDEAGSVGSLATFNASFESDGELYKYSTYNNGSYPQEGEGFLLGIDNHGIRFDYDPQRQGGPYVVEVAPNTQGTVLIFTNAVWAVLGNMDLADVLSAMDQGDSQTLEADTTAFGNTNGTYQLDITEQLCTIVCNNKPNVLYIYK